MPVIVTGSTGFIGQALVRALEARGEPVLRLGRSSKKLATSRVSRFARRYGPNVCWVHLSGIASVGACAADPALAWRINVEQLEEALQVAKVGQVGTLLFPSSGLVYARGGRMPLREDAAVAPEGVYAASKLAAEALIRSWGRSSDSRSVILRLANVFGPGMHPGSVVTDVLEQLPALAGGRARSIKLNDASAVRDFIFIDDVVAAILACLQRNLPARHSLYNVSTGKGASIGRVARILLEVSKDRVEIRSERRLAGSPSRRVLSNQKLLRDTPWRVSVGLRAGLERIYLDAQHG